MFYSLCFVIVRLYSHYIVFIEHIDFMNTYLITILT